MSGIVGLFRAIGQIMTTLGDRSEERRLGRTLRALGGVGSKGVEPPYIIRRDLPVVGRVKRFADGLLVDLHAKIVVPSGLSVTVARDFQLDRSRIREPEHPELREAVERALRGAHRVLLYCDASTVTCRLDLQIPRDALDAAIDAVVALARFDDGLTATLAALPGAELIHGHELDPGVALGDAMLIGVRGGAQTVAQLDGISVAEITAPTRALLAQAGEPALKTTSRAARLTWASVERDPVRLRAGVAALRSLVPPTGPYR